MDWAEGAVAFKTGLDLLRGVLGLVMDVQGVLPVGDKKDAIDSTLAEAERQLRVAEAQTAQGMGYPLCRCRFPPTPMLHVGFLPIHHLTAPDRAILTRQPPMGGTLAGSMPVH